MSVVAADAPFADWADAVRNRVERALEQALPESALVPQRLHQAMRYAVLGGGKRVRPLLTCAAGAVFAAPATALDQAACAVELIHAYSLVHDDLPCMDDDDLRRGKPTVHIAFDEATAMLVGDSLQSLAFALLSAPGLLADPAAQLAMAHQLAVASGSRGMAGGQAIDLDSVGVELSVPQLEHMHMHKTGALIRAAVNLGVGCGGALGTPAATALDRYAMAVGLAFQVVDDILDAEASTAELGKTAGKDEAANKPTYVSMLGIAPARELAQTLHARALGTLDGIDGDTTRLRQLAQTLLRRGA
ncbi:MAG: polyprenyl synthetase family protein [Burkholderiales bacterium]|jgi:farnesyl diphosphate synthase